MTVSELKDGILNGNRRTLSKAITLVESKKAAHRDEADALLSALMPYTGNSVRVGITGVPGAGKSTLIEALGLYSIENGHKVAVLAIDPSSSRNKGSILGDKTRMEKLSVHDHAYIRPSPTSGFLGGVANATFETMLLCEAAGYDFILIETVGVGQSETMVADISDIFVFLKLIGGGDELQGIKRGIMEMVDLVFINKVSDENRSQAQKTALELKRALHFMPPKLPGWRVPVLLGSALQTEGIETLYRTIQEFIAKKKSANCFFPARAEQAEKRFRYWVQAYFMQKSQENAAFKQAYEAGIFASGNQKVNPSSEARALIKSYFDDADSGAL